MNFLTEIYVGGHHLFKQTAKTLNEAIAKSHSGDTIILSGGKISLEQPITMPIGDILIEGHNTEITIPKNSLGFLLQGNTQLTLNDLTIILDGQEIGISVSRSHPVTGSINLHNCNIIHQHKMMHMIPRRECNPSLIGLQTGSNLVEQCMAVNMIIDHCNLDYIQLYAQSIQIKNSQIGSLNFQSSSIIGLSVNVQNTQFDHTMLVNLSDSNNQINQSSFGLNNIILGRWEIINSTGQYHVGADKKINKKILKKIVPEYELTDTLSILQCYNTKDIATHLVINSFDIDADSYQAWADRGGKYCWFNLAGDVKLKQLEIPPVNDNLPNIAGGSISLDDVDDRSQWTQQEGLKLQLRNSSTGLHQNGTGQTGGVMLNEKPKRAIDELNAMIGLAPVKKRLTEQLALENMNAQLIKMGRKPQKASMDLVFGGNAGTGKALTDDTLILTDHGYKRVDEVKMTDRLYGSDGKLVKINGIYPQKGRHHVYQVILKDGRIVKCNGSHIWTVFDKKDRLKPIDLTTRELLNSDDTFYIPRQPVMQFTEKNGKISPFAVGFFDTIIKDDSVIHLDQTQYDIELINNLIMKMKMRVLPVEYGKNQIAFEFKKEYYDMQQKAQVSDLHYLKWTDLDKTDYQLGSVDQRVLMFDGAYIANGHSSQENQQINLTYANLSQATKMRQILLSLGFNDVNVKQVAVHKYLVILRNVDFEFKDIDGQSIPDLYSLIDKQKHTELCAGTEILNVEKTNQLVTMTCFHVAQSDHLFMANDLVLTHNTTVAKLFAKALYEEGVIQNPEPVIRKVGQIEGEHLGESAHNMADVLHQARGGVFFLDEAYELDAGTANGGQANSYKLEMQNEILQDMENWKDLHVIFAGYTDEMQAFFKNNNEGFISRFNTWIDFPDYSPKELLEILMKMVNDNNYHWANAEAKQTAAQCAVALGQIKKRGSGNGRLMRNYYEKMIRCLALRLQSEGSVGDIEAMTTLTSEDARSAYQAVYEQLNQISGG